mmetsp:Transcript_17789/g.45288  ORF Transcript_17789/g.45288 Transcript_17789/m.45288 type:complete len:213 (+) Transcript_17789:202-840(+)
MKKFTDRFKKLKKEKRKENSSVVELLAIDVDGEDSRRSSTSSRLSEVLPTSIPTSREELPWHTGMSSKCSCIPSLSFKYRVIGFFITAGLGLAMSYLAGVFVARIIVFASLFTVGNLLCLLSTFFLVGPTRQLKMMWAPKRLVATIVFLAAMGVTLYAAFGLESIILCLIMVGVQTLALIWYCLSYIPYARTMIIKFFKATVCRPCLGSSSK